MPARTYYEVLNVAKDASPSDLRSAYLLLSRMFHPDRFDASKQPAEWAKANDLLRELNQAYGVLRDPEKRRAYDSTLRHGDPTPRRSPPSPPTGEWPRQHRPDASQAERSSRSARRAYEHATLGSVRFGALSPESRSRLEALQSGARRDAIVVSQRRLSSYWGLVALSLIPLGVCAFSTDSSLWSRNRWYVASALVALGLVGLWFHSGRIVEWRRSTIHPGTYVTTMYLLRTTFDQIWFRWLWDFKDLSTTNHYRNGSYTHSTVRLQFPNDREELTLKGRDKTDALLRFLSEAQRVVRTAAAQGDSATLAALDDLKDVRRATSGRARGWHRSGLAAVAAAGLGAFGAAFLFCCHLLNVYFDDLRAWQRAQRTNTATAMREYGRAHPDGRFVSAAKQQLNRFYEQALTRYRAQLSADHDSEAVFAIGELLDHARVTGNYRVVVTFAGTNAVPDDIHETLNRRHEIRGVLPVGDAFSLGKMRAREQRAFQAVQSAFRSVIPGDVLDLKILASRAPNHPDDPFDDLYSNDVDPRTSAAGGVGSPYADLNLSAPPGVDPRTKAAGAVGAITISYRTNASNSLFYRESQEHIRETSRPFYPGIVFEWDCGIRIAGMPDVYEFQLESKPAEKFTETAAGVYEDMTGSAFNDFRQELVKRLGLPGTWPRPSQ